MSQIHTAQDISPKQIMTASLLALSVALVLLLTAILPAEFNMDPLGTGRLLGIAGMSEQQGVGALNTRDDTYHRDNYEIVLAPFESVEYKYRLEAGATMLFDWSADGELVFDMHSEQDGMDPQEYAPSFDRGNGTGVQGSYTAPFPGIHGWFWENRGGRDVTLKLSTVGFYTAATEFRGGFANKKEFDDPAQ